MPSKSGRKQFVVVGDKKGRNSTRCPTPVFSAGGKAVAYVASEKDPFRRCPVRRRRREGGGEI
jgi:hypothetical protein